jgi:sRNA-binding regulator protein Hfq
MSASSSPVPLPRGDTDAAAGAPQSRSRKIAASPLPFRFSAQTVQFDSQNRHAELFYLQKQIQSQTPMVIVLEDGERIEGCIEWYDRSTLKVRGRTKTLVFKSAIKYMYKLGESGQ